MRAWAWSIFKAKYSNCQRSEENIGYTPFTGMILDRGNAW